MTVQLTNTPVQKFFDNNGTPLASGQLFTYVAGTSTKQATYIDSTQTTPNTNPIVLNARGEANVWLDTTKTYKFILAPATATDPPSNPIWTVDNISNILITYPQTAGELAAGITPVNTIYPSGDVRRWGITPNLSSAATANTVALAAVLNPVSPAYTGRVWFTNTSGTDTYYFNNMIQLCDGTRMDLGGCTINFSKVYAAADDTMGFFTFIRDVSIENGSITANYTGTGTNNAGPLMRIGSRTGYKFGSFTSGIFDQDNLIANGLPPMGNITLSNLRLNSNNPTTVAGEAILMLGGLQNCLFENIVYNGNGAASAGPATVFYYEFGFASTNGFPSTPAKWSSSHAQNLVFRNITSRNAFVATAGYAVDVVEAFSVTAENIHSDSQYGTFEYRIGEAHFFRPWTLDAGIVKRAVTLRNITAETPTGIAINLNASASTASGYLSDANMIAAGLPVLTAGQKVDLMKFSLDGFAVNSASGVATGIKIDGAPTIANGVLTNCFDGVVISGECSRFQLQNVEVYGATDLGIRANDAPVLFASRKKFGAIVTSKICGGAGVAIAYDFMQAGVIDYCQIGYNTLFDDTNEASQGIAVNLGSNNAGRIVCRGNYITTFGGAVAYNMSGGNVRGNTLINPLGTITITGNWLSSDGMGISADRGDNSVTLVYGNDFPSQRFATALTANRTITFSTTGVPNGYIWNITRSGLGAFTLDCGGLKTLPAGTAAWATVQYEAGAGVYRLLNQGVL